MIADLKVLTAGCRERPGVAEPTVSAGYARGLMELAVANGANRQALLDVSGVAARDLADTDARIPFSTYVALMRAAKALCGDPALALHYGEMVDIAEVSIVGLIGQASETMAEAFMQLNRYVRLIVEADLGDAPQRFGFRRSGGGLWMVDNRRNPNAFPELTESAFAQLVCGPRRFDATPFVKAVQFTHPEPSYRAEYERIFRAPVAFGAAWNGVQIDEHLPGHPVQRLPRYAFGVLTNRADELLRELEESKSTRGRVEALLARMLHTGNAGMDQVAARLGLSRQTLFRKLRAENATFEQVLDELRRKLAVDYLDGGKVSVNETAYLVGFSDPAAFSRAFKRWTGESPRAWREARAA